MAAPLESGSLKIATIMGIPLRVHFSWLIIFGLLTWSLSSFYFPRAVPDLAAGSYWASGAIAALLLFISVALHELSHSFVALRYKLPISSIVLFIFGGVSQIKGEPPDPKVEFRMAVAGPLASFALALVFYAAYTLVPGGVVRALFIYLAQINLVLGIFNLIPGFPMDGGRVVRAYLWNRSKDFYSATRTASSYGQKIALLFIILGVLSLFGGLSGGLWFMLIGWFLYTAAQASYQQAGLQETLRGVAVESIMVRDFVRIPPDTVIEEAVNDYFLRYGYGGFPVMRNGEFLGFVSLKEVKDVPRERWRTATVGEILVPHDRRWEIPAQSDAMKALELMISEDKGRLVVMERGSISGIITRNGIAKYIQIMGK
ncbi:MAG: site-2 protease family protein [Nitrospirota bacterium]